MSSFEISSHNGTVWSAWESLAAWRNLTRTTRNAATDHFTLERTAQTALTDALPWPHNTPLRIRRDSTQIFEGTLTTLPRIADSKNEQISLEISGPWHALERCTYQQSWKVWNTSTSALVNANKSRVILFQNSAGNRIAASAQITDALEWAISQGASLQIGTIDTLPQLPLDERNNLKVADVIHTVLRWFPDLVTWFDYSTSPPTFHCRKQAALSPLDIPLTNGHLTHITSRADLQVPGIHITYEQSHEEDGEIYNTVTTDTAGDTTALDTVYATFELDGTRRTYLRQKVVTEDLPADPFDIPKSFYKTVIPALADFADEDIEITASGPLPVHPRYLTEGNIPTWVGKPASRDTIYGTFTLTVRDALGGIRDKIRGVKYSIEVTSTTATTRTYKRLTAFDSGETVPSGVADALYASWSVLHHEGDFHFAALECPGTALPGRKLNLTGAGSELSTLNALIQETFERYDDGTTQVRFGPAAALEADTLVGLFRALRSRRYAWRRRQRTSATADDDSNVELGGAPVIKTISQGYGDREKFRILAENADEDENDINLDPSVVAYQDPTHKAPAVLQPREIRALFHNEDEEIVARKVQALCSLPYGDEEPAGGGDLPPLEVPSAPATRGETTEGPEAAQDTPYNLATADPAIGLALTLMTRVGYYHAGTQTLYGYLRTLTFTPDGRLASISAETRIVIDVPEL